MNVDRVLTNGGQLHGAVAPFNHTKPEVYPSNSHGYVVLTCKNPQYFCAITHPCSTHYVPRYFFNGSKKRNADRPENRSVYCLQKVQPCIPFRFHLQQ
jgi:hypothetical protein